MKYAMVAAAAMLVATTATAARAQYNRTGSNPNWQQCDRTAPRQGEQAVRFILRGVPPGSRLVSVHDRNKLYAITDTSGKVRWYDGKTIGSDYGPAVDAMQLPSGEIKLFEVPPQAALPPCR